MDLWQMITNDHANITQLCREIIGAMGDGVKSRDRLFDQLERELKRHMEAEEESLYDALEEYDRTERLVDDLDDEHEEIEDQLEALGRVSDKDTHDWTQRFEDFVYRIERHFHTEEHELLPAARALLDAEAVEELRHEFAREKIKMLRAERRSGWVTTGAILGAVAGVAAVTWAAVAWRNGSLGASGMRFTGGRGREQDRRVGRQASRNAAGQGRHPLPM